MGRGYIKLYRQSLDNGWLRQGDLWRFWCWCLLKAYHKPQTVTIGLQRVDIKVGQFPFGRKVAAEELKMSEQTVRTLLSKLVEWQNLTISSTSKFSVVTVVNWESYQGEDSKSTINQPTNLKTGVKINHQTNQQKTPSNSDRGGLLGDGGIESNQQSNQQLTNKPQKSTTINNVKNVKKVKNPAKFFAEDSPELKLAKFLWEEMKKRGCEDKKPDLQKWAINIDYLLRLDKREPRRIAEVIRWCQQDEFWKKNIRSTNKLRTQWAALVDEMKSGKDNSGRQTGYKTCVHSGCRARVPMADDFCPACRREQ